MNSIIFKDYEWVVKVIASCETRDHLDSANNLINAWSSKHISSDDWHLLRITLGDVYRGMIKTIYAKSDKQEWIKNERI